MKNYVIKYSSGPFNSPVVYECKTEEDAINLAEKFNKETDGTYEVADYTDVSQYRLENRK